MRYVRNSDRLREILFATRNQIVSLKDIQMDMMRHDTKLANNIATQISALEEVYKHQLTLVNQAENVEPRRNGWFSGHIKTKEDRLANIMD
jgi:regulatory protein YycI of two-component signal transduction system YycFG